MKTTIHPADSRGQVNHGWLQSSHSFSFGSFHNPERIHFGKLRVLNDDVVAPGMGFGKHPHDNMEIISIALEGDLQHEDSMGNKTIIRQGDVQVMSAGSGIAHSEKNKNHDVPAKFLQIWIFPDKKDVDPRYDQQSFKIADRPNEFVTVVSPIGSTDGGVQIHQQAWLSLAEVDDLTTVSYNIKKSGNGLYVFVLEGSLTINNTQLNKRDAMGIEEESSVSISVSQKSTLLLIDVPMN